MLNEPWVWGLGILTLLGLGSWIALELRDRRRPPPQREAWEAFARENGGEYCEEPRTAWRNGRYYVSSHVRGWLLTLDTYTEASGKTSRSYTRVSARYVEQRPFHFVLSPRTGLVLKRDVTAVVRGRLERGEVLLGDESFDEHFTLKSDDAATAASLFSAPATREAVLRLEAYVGNAHPRYGSRAFGVFPIGASSLYPAAPFTHAQFARSAPEAPPETAILLCQCFGESLSSDQVRQLHTLAVSLLDEMVRLGLASQPGTARAPGMVTAAE